MASGLIGDREQLLELVDHQEHTSACGKDGQHRARGVGRRSIAKEGGEAVPDGRCRQGRPELGERAGARVHLSDRPALRSGDGPLPQPREQARGHRARLPRPGWPDEGDESRVRAQSNQEPVDERVTPEEVGGIGLGERPKALVRIALRRISRQLTRMGQERRVMEQDPLLESLQRRRRIEPELVSKHRSELLVGPKRLGMAPAAIEREHQELPGAFAQRIVADGGVQHRDDLGGTPGLELRCRHLLDRVQVEVTESADVGLSELLVGEVRQRGAVPQAQCGPQHLRATGEVADANQPAPIVDEPLEPPGIDCLRVGVELVPRSPGGQHLPSADRFQRPTEFRHVNLDRVRCRARGMLAPQQVDEPIDRDDLSRVQQQDREERPLLRRAELGDQPVRGHRECPQKAKVHCVRRHWRVPPFTITALLLATMGGRALPALYGGRDRARRRALCRVLAPCAFKASAGPLEEW